MFMAACRPGGLVPSNQRSHCSGTSGAIDDEVLQHQAVDRRAQEAQQRVDRTAHDRFSAQVERCVQQDSGNRFARRTSQSGDETGATVGMYSLHACRAVDVGDGGEVQPRI